MELQVWQIVASLVVVFLFGCRIGFVMGESRAWKEMDEQECENERFRNGDGPKQGE